MRIGIDASNIRGGGGITHLSGILSAVQLEEHGIERIEVWAGGRTAARLPDRPGIRIVHEAMLDEGLMSRLRWQRGRLSRLASDVDILFVPGGISAFARRPMVSMAQNLLPFDLSELKHTRSVTLHARYHLLRHAQLSTFRRSDGIIFPSAYIRDRVVPLITRPDLPISVVPHGLDRAFLRPPGGQQSLDSFGEARPFRLLYVSNVHFYKHQWRVVEAVAALRRQGYPVILDLVGPGERASLRRLERVLATHDPDEAFVRYVGTVPYHSLRDYYRHADAFVFASSCESFGQVLLEAMASGLPIACSNRSSMPELLNDAGLWFDPLDERSMFEALRTLIQDCDLRQILATRAWCRASTYSWERCARDTFSFIQLIAAKTSRGER